MGSLSRLGSISALAVALCAFPLFAGCGESSASAAASLQAKDVRTALRGLPFEHRLKQIQAQAGDDAAFRVAASKGPLKVNFTVAEGHPPRAVDLPGLGTSGAIGIPSLGLAFNDDASYGKRFKTLGEWHKAIDIAVEIEERICRKVSGKPCPV